MLRADPRVFDSRGSPDSIQLLDRVVTADSAVAELSSGSRDHAQLARLYFLSSQSGIRMLLKEPIGLTLLPAEQLAIFLEAAEKDRPDLLVDALSPFKRYLEKNRASSARPIRSLLTIAVRRFNCFGLFESPYVDLEFFSMHRTFYGRSFTYYPRHCERLHFFQGNPNFLVPLIDHFNGQEADALDSEEWKQALDAVSYKGYVVFRPTNMHNVGKASICFDARPGSEVTKSAGGRVKLLPQEEKATPYLTIEQDCATHVLGHEYVIQAPEFIQQDPNLGRCATASLWVATHALSQKLGIGCFQYPDITEQALGFHRNRPPGLPYDPQGPDAGLTGFEIQQAFAETGLHSFVFQPEPSRKPYQNFHAMLQQIYSFVESGFPVLLFHEREQDTEGHVVVLVGHSLPDHIDLNKTCPDLRVITGNDDLPDRAKAHHLLSSGIRLFYAHDDTYGPYNRIVLNEPVGQNDNTKIRVGSNGDIRRLVGAMVPLPRTVQNRGTDISSKLAGMYSVVADDHAKRLQESGHLIWRALLVTGARFKESILNRQFSPHLRACYLRQHLPKYVWLYEVTYVNVDAQPEKWATGYSEEQRREIIGEFLYDATTPTEDTTFICGRIFEKFAPGPNESEEHLMGPQYSTLVEAFQRKRR